jgi:cytosine/uracil/thiamine/allantoin permease
MQNWRAAAAMIVSVSLTFPGLINNINPKVQVGVGARLFDISYLLGVSSTLSVLRPVLVLKLTGCVAHPSVSSLLHAFKAFSCLRDDP